MLPWATLQAPLAPPRAFGARPVAAPARGTGEVQDGVEQGGRGKKVKYVGPTKC
jgi:hypothetical protein